MHQIPFFSDAILCWNALTWDTFQIASRNLFFFPVILEGRKVIRAYFFKMHQILFFMQFYAETLRCVTHLKLPPETWFFFQVILEGHICRVLRAHFFKMHKISSFFRCNFTTKCSNVWHVWNCFPKPCSFKSFAGVIGRALSAHFFKMHQIPFFKQFYDGTLRRVTHLKLLPETWFFFQVIFEGHM